MGACRSAAARRLSRARTPSPPLYVGMAGSSPTSIEMYAILERSTAGVIRIRDSPETWYRKAQRLLEDASEQVGSCLLDPGVASRSPAPEPAGQNRADPPGIRTTSGLAGEQPQ